MPRQGSQRSKVLFAALQAGVRGYLLKGALKAEILRAIRAVATCEAIFGPVIAKRLINYFAAPRAAPVDAFPQLTERGKISPSSRSAKPTRSRQTPPPEPETIRNHVSNVFTKLQVADGAEAIIRAREAGAGKPTASPSRDRTPATAN